MNEKDTLIKKLITEEVGFESTEERMRDSLDFKEVHVIRLKKALEMMYEKGREFERMSRSKPS